MLINNWSSLTRVGLSDHNVGEHAMSAIMALDLWSVLILVNLLVAIALAALTLSVRHKPTVSRSVANAFIVFQLNMIVWTAARFLTYNAPDLASGYFWTKLDAAADSVFAPTWLALALAWNGYTRWLKPRWSILWALPEIALALSALTNDWHWQFISTVSYTPGPDGVAIVEGPLFYVEGVVGYVYVALALYLFIRLAWRSSGWLRQNAIMVTAVSIPPALIEVLRYAGLSELTTDVTQMTISLGATLYTFFVFRHWLFDIVKTALTQAAEQMGDVILVFNAEDRLIDANQAASDHLHFSKARLVGMTLPQIIETFTNRISNIDEITAMAAQWSSDPLREIAGQIELSEPASRSLRVIGWPTRGEGGVLLGHVVTLRDITAFRQAEEALQASEARYRDLFENALDIVYTLDLQGNFTSINKSGEQITGYTLRPDHRMNIADIMEPEQLALAHQMLAKKLSDPSATTYELDIVAKNGRRITLEINSRCMYQAGQPVGVQGIARDVTEARALTKQLALMATTDPLTGLPNHRHLMDRLDEEMARAIGSGHPLTIMMLDIDGFKLINDTYGHTVGDELLRIVARTLKRALRTTDILGRYGGDEFLVLLPESGRGDVRKVAGRILSAVESTAFQVPTVTRSLVKPTTAKVAGNHEQTPSGITLPLHISLGIAVFPIDSSTRLELISLADAAMYASKRAGGNTVTMAHDTDSAFLAAQNHTFGVLEALVTAVDAKDHYTRAHSEHVAKFALRLSDSLGIDRELLRVIRIAALLHDVGKIGIPDHILRKPGPLDAGEREIVRQHPLLSEMIMRETPQLAEILDAVRHHHERWDGQGYPRGLSGEDIPLIARILAIADAFSAMVTDRPYRKAVPFSEVISELRRGAGTQFDPSMVEKFIDVISSSPEFDRAKAVALR